MPSNGYTSSWVLFSHSGAYAFKGTPPEVLPALFFSLRIQVSSGTTGSVKSPRIQLVWTLARLYAEYRADGCSGATYDPAVTVAVLIYAYCVGNARAGGIERRLVEDVAFAGRESESATRPCHTGRGCSPCLLK